MWDPTSNIFIVSLSTICQWVILGTLQLAEGLSDVVLESACFTRHISQLYQCCIPVVLYRQQAPAGER